MKLLLDTHSFLWFIAGSEKLSTRARQVIEDPDNQVFLSTASLWEMAIKISLGKLNLERSFELLIPEQLEINNVQLLNITIRHVSGVISLPFHHRDPFDRLIIVQAQSEQMPVISADAVIDLYGIARVW